MTFLISSIAVILITFCIIILLLLLLLLLFPIKHKRPPSLILIEQMLKTLVINSEFKHLSMLNDIEHVVVDLEWILEWCTKLLHFKDHSAITENFLLPTQMTANQLNRYHLRVKAEFPNELGFGFLNAGSNIVSLEVYGFDSCGHLFLIISMKI